jgi:hypothetical protein
MTASDADVPGSRLLNIRGGSRLGITGIRRDALFLARSSRARREIMHQKSREQWRKLELAQRVVFNVCKSYKKR